MLCINSGGTGHAGPPADVWTPYLRRYGDATPFGEEKGGSGATTPSASPTPGAPREGASPRPPDTPPPEPPASAPSGVFSAPPSSAPASPYEDAMGPEDALRGQSLTAEDLTRLSSFIGMQAQLQAACCVRGPSLTPR